MFSRPLPNEWSQGFNKQNTPLLHQASNTTATSNIHLDSLSPNQWAESPKSPILVEVPENLKLYDEPKTFKCCKCSQSFQYRYNLLKHIKLWHNKTEKLLIEQPGKRTWTCTQCNMIFLSRRGLTMHQRQHGQVGNTGGICQTHYTDSNTLRKHQDTCHTIRPFICTICNQSFNQKESLLRHESFHSQLQNTYTFTKSNLTFSDSDKFQVHRKLHNSSENEETPTQPHLDQEKPNTTNANPLQPTHSSQNQIHKFTTEQQPVDEMPEICCYCTKPFENFKMLEDHMVIHAGIWPYICPICYAGFDQKGAIQYHMRSHASLLVGTTCPVCEKEYFSEVEFNNHFKEHLQQRPSFKSSSSVKYVELVPETHQSLGRNNLPMLRDAVAEDRAQMKAHEENLSSDIFSPTEYEPEIVVEEPLLVKKEEPCQTVCKIKPKKSYLCDLCGKILRSRNGFIYHQRNHRGERPFMCSWCDKSFIDKYSRNSHEFAHTGERPFKCLLCPKSYAHSSTLSRHKKTHHNQKAPLGNNGTSSQSQAFLYQSLQKESTTLPPVKPSEDSKKDIKDDISAYQTDDGAFPCTLCFAIYYNIEKLKVHVLSDHF